MATGVGVGFDMDALLNSITKADKALSNLMDKSNQASRSIITAFQQMNSQGVVPYVQSLEDQKRTLEQVKASITDVSGRAKKNFGDMKSSIVDVTNSLTTMINSLKSTPQYQTQTKLIDLSQQIDELQKYQKRQDEVKEASNRAAQQEINNYRQILSEIQRLNEVRKQAKETKATTTDTALKSDATKTLTEANKQLKIYKQQAKDIEQKYAVETELIKKDIALRGFQDRLRAEQDYQNKVLKLQEEAANRTQQRERALQNARGDSSKGALNYYNRLYSDKGVMSINNMNTALQKLRDAQNKLNLSTEEGRKKHAELGNAIARIEKDLKKYSSSADEVNNKHRKLMDTGGQLARALAVVFSVSAIKGYINNLVNIRKEFELQQKSLQVLLKSKDEADNLWQQTIDLAVRSPSRVKELVTYTKQLAAYRIEEEQLHDTTKRLADVSAGLGVDMNRLILAFGQVKAANFLRGTELRQFTEAGIPMLEELAKYFTELEGRAISVGDVFGRISNRMVSFSDVETVFHRMTNEGGTFYQMQEEQSKTLSGMISNYHDSIDLMLNDIGKAYDSTLKNAASFARKLAENWEDIADAGGMWLKVLSPLIARTLLLKAANMGLSKSMVIMFNQTKFGLQTSMAYGRWLVNLEKQSKIAALGIRGLTTAMRGLPTIGVAALGVGLISWITELYLNMTKASREAARLKKELNGIITEDVSTLEKNSAAYQDLYTRLGLLNKGTQARKEIIGKLNSEYGEYLSFVVDEETSVEQLAEAYDDVVKKMQEKQSLATFEKGMAAIAESYGNSLTDAKDAFYDLFKGASIKSNKDDFSFIVPTKKEIDDIYSIIQQRSREMKAEQLDDLNEQSNLIQRIVKDYYGEEFSLSRDFNSSIDLLDILVDKKEKEKELQEEINLQYKTVLKSREANLALEKLQTEYAEKRRDIENSGKSQFEIQKGLAELVTQEKLDVIDIKVRFGEMDEDAGERAKQEIINWATELNKSINDTIKINLGESFSEEDLSKVLITESMQKSQSSADYVKQIQSSWETQNQIIKEQISLKSSGLDTDESILENAEKLERLYRGVADILGIELKYTERLSEESRNAINSMLPEEYQITLEQAYNGIDSILSDLKTKEKEHLNVIEQLNEQKKNGLPIDEEKLRIAEENYWWVKKTQDLLDPSSKTAISEGRVSEINAKLEEKYQINSIDRTKDEVTLLSEANTEKEKAIAYEAQLAAMKAQGLSVTQEELDLAKKDIEQWTLRWKLLGGTDKEKTSTGRSNSLYDERIKVIDDMNKKYNELRKTLTETEAVQGAFDSYIDAFSTAYKDVGWIPKNVKEMSAEDFATKVLGFTDKDKLVEFLDKLAKEPMKTFEKIKVELAKGKYVEEMTVETRQDDQDKILKQIEDMFGNYEISLEMDKLNIPPDLAKRLFGVDAISLDDIRQEIETKLQTARTTGGQEDYIKGLEEQLKKVNDLEDKALKERMEEYVKYLRNEQHERIKLKMEEIRKISEIEAMNEFTPEEKEVMIGNVKRETNEKMAKSYWEDFEKSPMFLNLFDDMELATTQSLKNMRTHLESMRDSMIAAGLPASDLKEILDKINQVEGELEQRNPFKSIGEAFGIGKDAVSYKEFVKAKREEVALEEKLANLKASEREYIGNEETGELGTIEHTKQILANEEAFLAILPEGTEEYANQEEMVNNIRKALAKLIHDHQKVTGEIQETNVELDDAREKTSKLREQVRDAVEFFKQAQSSVNQIGGALGKTMGQLGMSEDNQAIFNAAQNVASNALGLGADIGSLILNPLDVENWVSAISNGIALIGNIAATGDAVRQKAINAELKKAKQAEKVYNDLVDKYEELQKAMEKAYTIEQMNVSKKSMEQNMDAQSKSIDEQIAALESANAIAQDDKKISDEEQAAIDDRNEQIKELKKQQAELKESQEELDKQFVETLGGSYDYAGVAEQFLDAWLTAFDETGDGMKGLEDSFDDFWKSVLKKQVVYGGASNITKEYLDKINDALGDDGIIDKEEKGLIEDAESRVKNKLDEFYKWANAEYGLASLNGEGELSGLQKGIQGITEDQADILAAYWNAVRFDVSAIRQKFDDYTSKMLDNDANPMVVAIKAQTAIVSTIQELLTSSLSDAEATAIRVKVLNM